LSFVEWRHRRSGAMIWGVPVDGAIGIVPDGDAIEPGAVPVVPGTPELLPVVPVLPIEPVVLLFEPLLSWFG